MPMTRVFPIALAVGLVAGFPRASRAAEPPADRKIAVEVDAAALPPELADAVEAEFSRLLAESEDLPAGVFFADDRRVYIEVQPSPIPGADDLLVYVELRYQDEILGESLTENCLACTEVGVADRALMLVEPMFPLLPAPEPAEPPAPAVVDASDAEPESSPAGARADPLTISGAALLGVGLVAVGVGVGRIVVDERVVSSPGVAELDVIKYRQPGIAAAVIGGAAAVAGATVLGIALGRRHRAGVTAAAPVVGPRALGFTIAGRF